MSLVNDALKRAGKSQPKNPPPAAGPPPRVAEVPPYSRNQDILFSFVVLLILCLGGVLLWQWSHGGNVLQVRARTRPGAIAAGQTSQTVASPDSAAPEAPIRMIPILPADTAPADASEVAAPPKPQPPAYVLQSVLYLPGNPSAIINGKTVRINSTVNDARVTAIGPGTATIVTAQGQTKVLAIPTP